MGDQGPTLPAVVMELGAHHLDLRPANPADPEEVVRAREKEKGFIKKWLAEGSLLCEAGAPAPPPPPEAPGIDLGNTIVLTVVGILGGLVVAAGLLGFIVCKMKRTRLPR